MKEDGCLINRNQKKKNSIQRDGLPKFKNSVFIYFQPCMTVFLPCNTEDDVRQNDNGYHSHSFALEKMK